MFVIASCSSLVLGFFLYIRVQLQIVSISQYIYKCNILQFHIHFSAATYDAMLLNHIHKYTLGHYKDTYT
jgi:hypothetical protein